MSMTIQYPAGPTGAEIHGIRLDGNLTDTEFDHIRKTVHERGVAVVRDQELSEEDHVAFARRFGNLQKIFLAEHLSSRYPELFLVSNILENGKPIGATDAGKFWHTDGAYLEKPHNVSLLYALEVPHREDGQPLGDTLFAGMGPAYEALTEEFKARLDGLRAYHDLYHRYGEKEGATAEMGKRAKEYPPASHPLVITHPDTGKKCLYLSEGYTTHIEGMTKEQSSALLAELCEHVVRPEFQYRHRWAVGDLLIWDNRATLHRATFDYQLPRRRLMRRATVAGQAIA
ncbi:TauD/TfdA family dioxygenase [Bordetella sp. BOR01]|uniref:TauD/TfdA dioxygenase family protein n=1 Tax=Bordetella sp. BOR01 TaxID=2854779 RepID=UPI001C46B4F1|nr:TauD/TfdA family dioxygenase [Bordetella sp. BOR01]MBV7483682.1 TauD/TfdA family dioxygenase [Bordetella sp. BOR01]